MKRKIIIYSIILICIISIVFIFLKKHDDIYSPTIRNIDSFVIENNTRYIILYSSEENKYYLGELSSDILDNNLYYLGDTACNFKKIDNNIIISNSEQVVYSSENYNLLPNEVYDIKTLGKLMISYDSKNHDMQILKRDSEAKCILKFKYYNHFIPIDLIET